MAFTSLSAKGPLLKWASRLRFPTLFLLTTVVFLLNLFIPDIIPFVDEIILGLTAAMLGNLRKKPADNKIDPQVEEKENEHPIS